MKECQATKEDLIEGRRKCDHCKRTAHFESMGGFRLCFRHWRSDYQYGMCHGLWNALRHTKVINIFRIN